MIARLGTPDSVATRLTAAGSDTVAVLVYPHAAFVLTVGAADGIEMLREIRTWGPAPQLPPAVSFGATTQSGLLTLLGRPNYTPTTAGDSTVLSYQWFGPDSEIMDFYVVRDTLRMLRLRFRMG